MDFFERNVSLLRKRIGEGELPIGDSNEIKSYIVETTKSGEKTLKYTQEDKTLYVHSKFAPTKEGISFAEKFRPRIEKTNVIILFGMGLGYPAKGFLKFMNPNNMLIIYEPSWHIFKTALENVDLEDVLTDSRVAFTIGRCFDEIHGHIASFINHENYEHLIYAINPFYQEKYLEEYRLFTKSLSDAMKKNRILFETFRGWGKLWTETILNNMRHMIDSDVLNNFRNIFCGRPVVVVAAGPSLDKNVDLIKKVEGKFPIVCVYTAYKVLQKHNIRPDFIVTLDSSQTKFETEEAKKEIFDIPVVYLCIANTQLLDRFTSNKIYCHTEHDIILGQIMPEKFKNINGIFVGGSVTISALFFACFIGGNPVIMTGFDLALTDDKTHAAGTFYDYVPKLESNDIKWIDGAYGTKVKSTLMFESYLRSTEEVIRANSHIQFIDATEGGALKAGSIVDTLANAIDAYENDVVDDVAEILEKVYEKEKFFSDEDLIGILDRLKKSQLLSQELREYLREGKELSQKVLDMFKYGKPDQNTIDNIVNRYYELDDKINDILEVTPLFYTMIERIKFVLKFHQPYHESRREIYFAQHSFYLYREVFEITEKIDDSQKAMIEYLEEKINKN